MEVVFLYIFVALLFHHNCVEGEILTEAQVRKLCEASTINTCAECIQAHPECAWCAAPLSGSQIKRCRRYSTLVQSGGCQTSLVQFPTSNITLDKNDALTTPGSGETPVVQLQPQRITVDVRNGDRVKFNVTFRKVTDYPVDLYYLMDLSFSMLDDLDTLKTLGERLANDIKSNVTQDIQMGFGTFVDKVLLPFTSTVPEQLKNPCIKNTDSQSQDCAPPFGFKHQTQISDNLEAFRNSVASTKISGNIDAPEGVFDALMQIAVCGNATGWRSDASHLVVVTTDASFHMALDGKLAAILDENDMHCHLSRGTNPNLPADDVVYDKSTVQDYPSIGQLRSAFADNKIQPIFAVTKDVQPLYEELRSLIPNSYVDELAADSSNIISIIKAAYDQLRGKLDMTLDDNLPNEITLRHRVLCPNSTEWKVDSLSCDQIQIGSKVVYEFEAEATGCPSSVPRQPLTFTSSSLQESVQINFNFLCDCSCSEKRQLNSGNCNGRGSLTCGVCECNSGYEGSTCQCEQATAGESLVGQCKQNGDTDDVCEGNGRCECGECLCDSGYNGTYCQCSNTGCPTVDSGVCGGLEKGICRNCDGNGICKCINEWKIDPSTNTCTCKEEKCINPGTNVTCSGNGNCTCSRCECFRPSVYTGSYCETCISPECKSQPRGCEESSRLQCAQCVNDAQRLREHVRERCDEICEGVTYEIVSFLPNCESCQQNNCPPICGRIDTNVLPPENCLAAPVNSECRLLYKIVWSQREYLVLVKEFKKEEDCPQPIDPLWIILPIVGGIVLLGILCLIMWKIYQTNRDKREWVNFENEMKKSKWTKGQNPIFEKPCSRFENPTFQDASK